MQKCNKITCQFIDMSWNVRNTRVLFFCLYFSVEGMLHGQRAMESTIMLNLFLVELW